MAPIAPRSRPYYPPVERMAILELRSARGWSLEETAREFLVTAATIGLWVRRLEEDGPNALVQSRQPVNKFPDFVGPNGPPPEDGLPRHGQGEDRPIALPRRSALGRHHRRPHAQAAPYSSRSA